MTKNFESHIEVAHTPSSDGKSADQASDKLRGEWLSYFVPSQQTGEAIHKAWNAGTNALLFTAIQEPMNQVVQLADALSGQHWKAPQLAIEPEGMAEARKRFELP